MMCCLKGGMEVLVEGQGGMTSWSSISSGPDDLILTSSVPVENLPHTQTHNAEVIADLLILVQAEVDKDRLICLTAQLDFPCSSIHS